MLPIGMGLPNPKQGQAGNDKVKVSSGDTTPDYLENKVVAGTNVTVTKLNPGANETLEVAASGGGSSPLTTKGDLITHNATVDVRLPVGITNGDVLTVDNTQPEGIKWATPAAGSPPYGTFQARLTLIADRPVTDGLGGDLHLTPYMGNWIGLYTGGAWEIVQLSDISISNAGLIKGVAYDVFVYDNLGTLTLELVPYKHVAATNNPAAGANVVIDVPYTSSLWGAEQDLTVTDGINTEVAQVVSVIGGVSITVATLVHSYTTPDIYGYAERSVALVTQDGVLCKTGALDRRYCGTIGTVDLGFGAQFADTHNNASPPNYRLVWNYYNRVKKTIIMSPASFSTWDNSTTSWRPLDNDTTVRVYFVTGADEDTTDAGAAGASLIELHAYLDVAPAGTPTAVSGGMCSLGFNATDYDDGDVVIGRFQGNNDQNLEGVAICHFETQVYTYQLGINFIQFLEQSVSAQHYHTIGDQCYMLGSIWC